MDKIQEIMERFFRSLCRKIERPTPRRAVRDAFTLSFPLTMAGSMVLLINYVLLDPSGFIASLLNLGELIPNLTDYQAVLSSVINGTTNILSLLIAFLVAYQLAGEMDGDRVLCADHLTFCLLHPLPRLERIYRRRYGLINNILPGTRPVRRHLCRIVRCRIADEIREEQKLRISMPEMVPPAVSKSFNLLIPIIITLSGDCHHEFRLRADHR